jgi:hypothetical protein
MFEPKPDINVNRIDPFYAGKKTIGSNNSSVFISLQHFLATIRHFQQLMQRYGAPIAVLNLIKQSEKRPRESKLNKELNDAMRYINSTLPDDLKIAYIAWDWKAAVKMDLKGMIAHMCRIAEQAVDTTGFFALVCY